MSETAGSAGVPSTVPTGTESRRTGHGSTEPWGICLVPHPLLEDVRCQRLQGHPGTHGAEVETRSAEIYLEWSGDPESSE